MLWLQGAEKFDDESSRRFGTTFKCLSRETNLL